MRTNLSIDQTLLAQALLVGGLKAESETINLALDEFVKKRTGKDIIALFNTVEYDENYDYKQLRGKR
jgi:Arc/MetJ family transcription regulator